MGTTSAMDKALSDNDQGGTRVKCTRRNDVAGWKKEAIEGYRQGADRHPDRLSLAAAYELANDQKVTDMLAGARPIYFWHLIPLLEPGTPSAEGIANWINKRAGFRAPEPVNTIELSTDAAQNLFALMQSPLWELTAPIYEKMYRVRRDLLEMAVRMHLRKDH